MRELSILLMIMLLTSGCSRKDNGGAGDNRVFYTVDEFSMGADLSYVNQLIYRGAIFRDSGEIMSPYAIFKKYGANTIRFRLWHNPQWSMTVYDPPAPKMHNDFNDVKKGITGAKKEGMAVNLDFHYSDSWADPSKQVPPAAWSGLSLTDLHDSIYNYTLKTLERLEADDLMPEFVQLGNEINPGFLLPQGDRWARKADFVYLMNSAIKAVRDASLSSSVKPKIIIHVAQPENVISWFDGMTVAGLTDFDIVGISYYYMWSDTGLDDLSDRIAEIKSFTGKDVIVVETAYPWTTGNADGYNNIIATSKILPAYPATKNGQYGYLVRLTQEIIDGGGTGLHYWEPAWITSSMKDLWGTGSAWDCNTLFDFSGNVIKGMEYMTFPYIFPDQK